MTGNELDRTLAEYLEAEAAAPAPAGLLEQVVAGTARRRPRPGWRVAFRATRMAADTARGQVPRARGLLILAVVGSLLAATALLMSVARQAPVTPSESPSPEASIEATASPVTASPTPSATPAGRTDGPSGPPIGTAWEPATGIDGFPNAIAHGPSGWVAVGTVGLHAGAWFSTDGLAWSGGAIPGGTDTTLTTVATDGSSWFAAGQRLGHQAGGSPAFATAVVYRSADGRSWSQVGEIPQGSCFEGCPALDEIAVGPGGVIISTLRSVEGEFPNVTGSANAYWSQDGTEWTAIDSSAFGLDSVPYARASAATFLGGRLVIVGGPSVWSSADGRSWTEDGTLTPAPDAVDVATDGGRLVVVQEVCAPACETVAWASADGRSDWTRAPGTLPIRAPRVTYAAGTFVVAGRQAPTGIGVFVSADGIQWTDVRHDLPATECGVRDIGGSDDAMVAVSDAACAPVWVSRAPAG